MEVQQHRGRSSSVGQHPNQVIRHSPSPHNFHNHTSPAGIPTTSTNFNSQSFQSNASPAGGQYNLSPPPYLNGSAQQAPFQQHVLPSNDFGDQNYRQSYLQNGLESGFPRDSSQLNNSQTHQLSPPEDLSINPAFEGFTRQSDLLGKQGENIGNEFILDPRLNIGIQTQGHINPADIMSTMSSPQSMIPTPPHQLMPPEAHSSGQTSPVSNHGQQWSPHHSRNASLDPAAAAFMNGQQQSDWTGMQFQNHRRAPSEHSDVSSSVAPSPYLVQQDSFETFDHSPSPLLNAQQDPQMFESGLGIESFTLSEPQDHRHSPRHSPFVSPRMSPQPGPGMPQEANFMSVPNSNFNGAPGSEIYTTQPEQFPAFPAEERLGPNEMGQIMPMAPPPDITVEFAPTTRHPGLEPPTMEPGFDALSPPERGKNDSDLHGSTS